ncbi:ABC transporter permease [Clostridium vincentii]|uniref:Inner membrane ABC transporter permease protein YdcV n=1 Tax=Clostridium vincentii TaxID=52704 RepID=A0A2T0BAU1_9CLOT|nr:ABC transporter permease [Clostridium vincentii]PRR81010.1 Inner membrane ABC transporter permease protein YdcV [Clostridium vincentii]
MKKKGKRKAVEVGKNAYIGFVYLFLYLPIIVLIIFSFNTSKMNIVFEGFTTKWYGSLFSNRSLMEALGNTLIIALVSTLISGVIGTLAAVGLERFKFKGKNIIDKLLYIPVVIPEIVLGIALLSVFSLMNIQLGLFTIILAHVTFQTPFVIITVRARLSGFDMSIEEAAMDLGANRFQTFMKITLPLIAPGVLSGVLLAFTLSLDDVIISFFTAGPGSNTLPLKIFAMVKTGVTPEVNALSTIIIMVTIIGVTLVGISLVRKQKRNKI